VKFLDIEIDNFLAITYAKINLADRGLVLVQGVNNQDSSADSNGAGKSSIADALSWALYGETARGVSGDDVINDDAKKGTRVAVRILDGAFTYTIARHRKHKVGKNSLTVIANDGFKDVDLTKGTEKLTQQEVVLKIVGASHDVFRGAVYAGQEQMPDLPAMTDKQLKLLIEEAAGTAVLEGAYKRARESLAAAQLAHKAEQDHHDRLVNQAGWIRDQIASTKRQSDNWVIERDNKVAVLHGQVVALLPRIKGIEETALQAQIDTLTARVADCDARLAAVSSEATELARHERELAGATAALRTAQAALQMHKLQLDAADRDLATVDHRVGCPCTECGRPLTENELAATRQAVISRRDTVQKGFDTDTAAVQAAQDRVRTLTSARDAFAQSMTDTSAVSTERASLQRLIDIHKQSLAERARMVSEALNLRSQMQALQAAPNPFEGLTAKHDAELAAVTKEIAIAAAKVEEQAKLVEVESQVVRIYSPAGVRAHILDEVTPYLNQQTSKYLGTLSDGNIEATWTTLAATAKGELREKFSIDVTNKTGGKIFKGISGGEKRKVRVATALALQDLVATRAVKPIELFIGDEIDDALDPAGLERLTVVLEEKARERGSVFVISHESLKDWVSNVLTIEKGKDGKTTVSEARV